MIVNREATFHANLHGWFSHHRPPAYKARKFGTHLAQTARFDNFTVLIALVLFAFSSFCAAQSENPSPQMGISLEPANSGNPTEGELIDNFTGKVTHEVPDLVIPGGGGLDILVSRAYNKNPLWGRGVPFGALDWEISVPRIYLAHPENSNWCEDPRPMIMTYPDFGPPNFNGEVKTAYMDPTGVLLSVPGGQVRALLTNTGAAHRYVTTDFWKADCITADSVGGRGFKVTSPAGVTYFFDQTFITPRPIHLYMFYYPAHLVPSKIEDRFGNRITYEYVKDPNGALHVKRIVASDGREVTFSYHDAGRKWRAENNVFVLDSFTSGTRTWNFEYESDHLKSVTRPDGTKFEYSYGGDAASESPIFYGYLAGVKYPSGATVNYDQVLRPFTIYNPSNGNTATFNLYSLRTRTWSDSVSSYGKTFTYTDAGNGRQYTTVSSTSKTERFLIDASQGVFRGRVLEHKSSNPDGTLLETTSYQYNSLRSLGWPYSSDWASNAATASLTVLTSKNIVRGSDTFRTEFTDHNEFGQSRDINETDPNSSFSSRLTRLEYLNDQTLWVLGEISSKRVARRVSGSDALAFYQTESTTFDALARPFQIWKNGLLKETRGYDAESNLAWSENGLNRRTQWLNYYRGSPKNTTYPDSTTSSQVINNFGEQEGFTDENTNTTTYQRDSVGRITRIDYPTGDILSWAPRITTREFLTSTELGHPAGTWKETTTHAIHEQRTFYNGFGWPVQIRERDIGTGRIRSRRFQYDELGRKTFESDWSEDDSTLGSGTYTDYDALDRVVQRRRSQGTVLEQTAYLSGNRKQVTDADGKATTITHQAFGEPDYSRPTLVESPEGQSTSIVRDHFGKVTSVTQSGLYNGNTLSATRIFNYDANKRLCRRFDPESGSTLWGYDNASQIVWEAKGQSSAGCVAQPSPDATIFGYDLRGRKKTDVYPSPDENVAFDYDLAGNLKSVSNSVVTWSYTHNKRNLLETELAQIDSKSFLFDRAYNSVGHLNSLITPSRTINYQPDAWGRPTVLGSYGSGIQYHPTGLPKSYTLGNGLSYSLTLNDRQWPDLQTTNAGETAVQKYKYSYSNAGDLTFLDDQVDGADDATLAYDDLHRLETATGPIWGTYTYAYDPLNNIRSRAGTSALNYTYLPNNQLAAVTGAYSRNYGYNERGEITGDGTKSFVLNQRGQIIRIVGGASYAYDGNGKRIKSTQANGTVEYALYDRSGSLVYSNEIPPSAGETMTSQSSPTFDETGSSREIDAPILQLPLTEPSWSLGSVDPELPPADVCTIPFPCADFSSFSADSPATQPDDSVYSDLIRSTSGLLGYWRLGEASGTVVDSAPVAPAQTYTEYMQSLGDGSYWELDEASGNFLDSIAAGVAGVPSGSILRQQASLITANQGSDAGSLRLNTFPAGNVTFGNAYEFPATTDAYSVLFWADLRTDLGSTGDVSIGTTSSTSVVGSDSGWLVNVENGLSVSLFGFRRGPNAATVFWGPALVGRHLFVVTYNLGVVSLYLDETLVGSSEQPIPANTGTFLRMRHLAADSSPSNVDNLRIIPRALTNAEIADIYANGTVANIKVGGNHGTVFGTVERDVAGMVSDDDGAVRIAPGSRISYGAGLNSAFAGRRPWTIEAWTNVPQVTDPTDTLDLVRNLLPGILGNGTGVSLKLRRTGGGVYTAFILRSFGTSLFTWSEVPVESSRSHLVGMYDGVNLSIFVNGKLRGVVADPNTTGTPTLDLQSAAASTESGGLLDELAIYSRALSAEEVARHFAAGNPAASGTIQDDPTDPDIYAPLTPPDHLIAPPADADGYFKVTWGNQVVTKVCLINIFCNESFRAYVLEMAQTSSFAGAKVLYDGPMQSHNVSALPAGTYYFRVKVRTWVCRTSLFGNEYPCGEVYTDYYPSGQNQTVVDPLSNGLSPPANPTPGSVASPGPRISSVNATLSWTASTGATKYMVVVTDARTGLRVADHKTAAISYTIALQYDVPYRWNVKACNIADCSANTLTRYFKTPLPPPPATPTNPLPGSTTAPGPTTNSNSVLLSWTQSSGATSYTVDVVDVVIGNQVASNTSSASNYTATLDENVTYRWTVKACSTYGCSSSTAPLYFETPSQQSQTDYLQLNGQTLVELKLVGSTTLPKYLHPDLLGSPRMATNANGLLLWREHYDPYGQKLNSVVQKIGYTGHTYDAESGYTYMQARFYDPLVGRFLSIDPEDFKDSSPFTFNRYSYANNNPYRYKDPNGESPIDLAFLAIDGFKLGTAIASGNPAAIQSAAIDFGLSAIGVASPLPGTGQALKIARAADHAADAARGAVTAEKGGLNLFKWGEGTTTKADGWRDGDFMLHLPDRGSAKANWEQNAGRLREQMRQGNPIFDSYRNPATGERITTDGFLRAERNLLESRGWQYNSTTGAYRPPSPQAK